VPPVPVSASEVFTKNPPQQKRRKRERRGESVARPRHPPQILKNSHPTGVVPYNGGKTLLHRALRDPPIQGPQGLESPILASARKKKENKYHPHEVGDPSTIYRTPPLARSRAYWDSAPSLATLVPRHHLTRRIVPPSPRGPHCFAFANVANALGRTRARKIPARHFLGSGAPPATPPRIRTTVKYHGSTQVKRLCYI
jgi:hypothetical protein